MIFGGFAELANIAKNIPSRKLLILQYVILITSMHALNTGNFP